MKKSELRNGMVVETRNGDLYLVVGDFITREYGFCLLSSFDENMLSRVKIFDIMRVYKFNSAATIGTLFDKTNLTLLWEREEDKHII